MFWKCLWTRPYLSHGHGKYGTPRFNELLHSFEIFMKGSFYPKWIGDGWHGVRDEYDWNYVTDRGTERDWKERGKFN